MLPDKVRMYTSAGMIDISPPNLKPVNGTIAMLQAPATIDAKKTIDDNEMFRRQYSDIIEARITEGIR